MQQTTSDAAAAKTVERVPNSSKCRTASNVGQWQTENEMKKKVENKRLEKKTKYAHKITGRRHCKRDAIQSDKTLHSTNIESRFIVLK